MSDFKDVMARIRRHTDSNVRNLLWVFIGTLMIALVATPPTSGWRTVVYGLGAGIVAAAGVVWLVRLVIYWRETG